MSEVLNKLFIDPTTLPEDGFGLFQLAFLGAVYGWMLLSASNMISDGSELLLLTKYASLVGPVVLPILGAVPDGAVIMFSGSTQGQLAVGVGALAGSTIMLLTVPWALATISGRVLLTKEAGVVEPNYRRAPPRAAEGPWFQHLFDHGCSVDDSIVKLGWFMLLSSLSYLIIQVPSFRWGCAVDGCGCDELPAADRQACLEDVAAGEKIWALIGLVTASLLFVAYLVWQYHDGMAEAFRRQRIIKVFSGMTQQGYIELHGINNSKPELAQRPDKTGVMDYIIRREFKKFDTDSSNSIDRDEFSLLAAGLGCATELVSQMKMKLKDDDKITYEEFEQVMTDWMNGKPARGEDYGSRSRRSSAAAVAMAAQPQDPAPESAAYDDEELEEIAETTAAEEGGDSAIWTNAFFGMFAGTGLVLFFADPMVGVLSEIGRRTGIPAFYVAFVLAPLASNASELVAAMNYAAKKTKHTFTISLANLLGAACMNNTFCLAIFLLQVYNNKLIWEFSAETISIVVVELVVYYFASRELHPTWQAPVVLALFPLSLVMVWSIENIAGLD